MNDRPRFSGFSRFLHWTMAIMVLVMLYIGVWMVSSLTSYRWLVAIHKPLGIAILILVAVRFINRLFNPPPPLPAGMPSWQKLAAKASHFVLYGLLFALPVVGWGMLSAGDYPIVLYKAIRLPPILPPDPFVYAQLRKIHTLLAYLLFLTFLAHFAAALMHALIFRDGVFESMTSWKRGNSSKSSDTKVT